jgi:ribosomal protein S18 acetylase RimI-like enzyme
MITIPLRPGFGGQVAPGSADDFHHANAFVAAAIKDAFYRPGLTAEEIAENDRIVSVAERTAREAVDHPHRAIFVAKDDGKLAGFVIVDLQPALSRAVAHEDEKMPEIDWLIVGPEWQGKGVAGRLMEQALAWAGAGVPVQLGVIHFNARAIAFYKKWGFEDTGRIVGRHKIPRRLMVRPAFARS